MMIPLENCINKPELWDKHLLLANTFPTDYYALARDPLATGREPAMGEIGELDREQITTN